MAGRYRLAFVAFAPSPLCSCAPAKPSDDVRARRCILRTPSPRHCHRHASGLPLVTRFSAQSGPLNSRAARGQCRCRVVHSCISQDCVSISTHLPDLVLVPDARMHRVVDRPRCSIGIHRVSANQCPVSSADRQLVHWIRDPRVCPTRRVSFLSLRLSSHASVSRTLLLAVQECRHEARWLAGRKG